jgi:hypothetical protein
MKDDEWNWDDAKKMDSTSKELKIKFFVSNTVEQSIGDWQNVMADDTLSKAQDYFLMFIKDATLLYVNLQILKKPRWIKNGLLQ